MVGCLSDGPGVNTVLLSCRQRVPRARQAVGLTTDKSLEQCGRVPVVAGKKTSSRGISQRAQRVTLSASIKTVPKEREDFGANRGWPFIGGIAIEDCELVCGLRAEVPPGLDTTLDSARAKCLTR